METKSEALAVSPDGSHLYFAREPADSSLWRLNLQNLSLTKVLDGLVPGCTSCWALAENGIYFLGSDTESFDNQMLFFYDFKNTKNRLITRYPEPLWPLGSGPFSLAPDGSSLLCVRAEPSSSNIMLVDPFR